MLNTRIKILSAHTVNQIAAGEVIERPASVLKELLENSLDAHATQIEVLIYSGGLQSIEVRDNGHGVFKDDLLLTTLANATSKLSSIEDLDSLATLGFRGEALASIDAVADLQITSKTASDELAWTWDNQQVLPAAHPQGTSVKVSNLFYKIPVRKKFLRSARLEFIYLEQVWMRLALSHFDVALALYHNERLIKKVAACASLPQQEQRLCALVGNLKDKILHIDAEHGSFKLSGWIILPEYAQSTSEHQYVYLNQRFVKDKLLNHAIKEAYAQLLLPGKHLLYCLYLSMPPPDFDVNVHPTKLEVRFKEPRVIHDFIFTTLRDALRVPLAVLTPQGYKLPLATSNAPASQSSVLSVLEQRILLLSDGQHLEIVDLLKLKNALLRHTLIQPLILKYELLKPLSVSHEFCPELQAGFNKLALIFEQLSVETLVVRALPKIIHDLELRVDYPKLFNMSKSTNLIDALCASTHLNKACDISMWLSLALKLAIIPHSFKKIYSAEQLAKLL